MKEPISIKIGTAFLFQKEIDKMKKITSVFLAILMIFGDIPIIFAANSLEESMRTANLYGIGSSAQLLTWQGIVASDFTAQMIVHRAEDGTEYPAYCINPNRPGVDDLGNYIVGIDETIDNPQLWGTITNGFPYKTAAELGLNSDFEAYYATKMAIWSVVHDNYSNISDWRANGENNAHVLEAMRTIRTAGLATTSIPQAVAKITVTPSNSIALPDGINSNYVSQTFTVSSAENYFVSLGGNAPAGAKVTDSANNEKSSFSGGEVFKVLIPVTVSERRGNFDIAVTAESTIPIVFFGNAFDSSRQNYAVTTREPIGHTVQAMGSYELGVDSEPTPPPEPTPIPTSLQVIKVDEGTLEGLAGAVFRVSSSTSGVIGDYITDGNGQINIMLEDEGEYYVEEIVAPFGYHFDIDNHKHITVTATQDAILTFANRPLNELIITKTDFDTGEKLEGAIIRVAYDGGHNFTDVQTDVTGTAIVSNLPDGTYTVTEIAAPNGYLLDNTPHTIRLESGIESAITLTNQRKPGLLIKKFDEGTAFPLEGAEFSVARMGGSIVYEGITDKDGEIKIEGLDDGWYTITEIAAPPGYLMANESKNVYLEAGKLTEIKFDNRLRPALQIIKVDEETNEPLAGAVFHVRKTEGLTVSEYITDESGTILINDLDEDIYSVVEIKAPDGYLLDSQQREIQLEWGTAKTLVFMNKARPKLEILKVDEETNEPLAGAIFRVNLTEGNTLGEFTTDETGRILLEDLEDKIYSVQEILAPDGYLLNSEIKTIELEWGATKTLVFTNKARPKLEILKVDEETNEPQIGRASCRERV